MNYSGILVMARPENLPTVVQSLNALEGVEVFQQDGENGRVVAVLEAENIRAETDILQTIKALPGVAAAEMVYHYFEDDHEVITHIPEELDKLQGMGAVPQALQDN
jgi:nitrate reductase NapAB chaperone NapD